MITKPLARCQLRINGLVMTVQQQWHKCHKKGCWCGSPQYQGQHAGHGPYFVGKYRGEDGKLKSHYIGKSLPEGGA